MSIATEVGCSFASEFLELLTSQQYAALGRMFLVDNTAEHISTLSSVDSSGRLDVYRGAEILDALSRIFASIARKNVVVEDVVAHQISAGVSATVTFSSEAVVGTLVALLEHNDDESFFVRDIVAQLSAVAVEVPLAPAVVEEAVTVEETPAVVSPAQEAPAAEEVATVEVASVVAPVVTSKGKKGKKSTQAAAPAAPAAEPEVEQAVVVEEPVAVVVAAEEPVVETKTPEPELVAAAVPAGPKSWASLARAPAQPGSQVAPVKVVPPSAAPAEPVVAKEAKPVKREDKPAPRQEATGDRLMFSVQGEVTDDEIKAALGKHAASIHSLRNQSKQNRVFVDFNASNVMESFKEKPITIKGFKIVFQRQKERTQQQA